MQAASEERPAVRKCRWCDETKALEEFKKAKNCDFGRTHMCLDCHNKQVRDRGRTPAQKEMRRLHLQKFLAKSPHYLRNMARKYRDADPERFREKERRQGKNNRERINELSKQSRIRNIGNVRAREHAVYARISGRLVRPAACEECGASCTPNAHHDDYSKPLAVRWLCTKCHGLVHRQQ